MNAMIEWFGILKDSGGESTLGMKLYAFSGIAIGVACCALAGAELYLLRKRRDLSQKSMFWLFIVLMSFFGIVFLCDGLQILFPFFSLSIIFRLTGAIVVWGIFILFVRAMPRMLSMRSQNQLKEMIEERTSEVEKINQKLVESEAHFKVLVNHHPDLISLLDKNFRYIFVNKTVLQTGRIPEELLIGKTIYELGLPEEFVKLQEHYLQKAFQTGEYDSYETFMKLPQLGTRRLRFSVVPVFDTNGQEVESVLNLAKDVTDQKEFENELNETIHELQELSGNLANKNRQLQDFAYIVSHNLRSPMSNLVALMNLYENEKSAEQKEFLVRKIGEVTRSFSKTIDELTEVVKIRQQINIEFQHHRFEEVVEDIKTMLDRQIVNSNSQIHYDFSACDTIRYPKVYLESILLNLITNAIKYRSEQRELTVRLSTRMVDGSILLICEDNGLGIDLKKFGDKIFGMNKTFHPNPDSRGMGLFITRNQIESLGGSITVESELGKGSVFTVLFG